MRKHKSYKCPLECGFVQSITLITLLSLMLAALQYICRAASEPTAFLSFLAMPLLPLANALPLILVMLIVYSATSRVWAGYLAAALPLFTLLTVNYFKVYFRAETLSAHDFSLVSEAADIITGYSLPLPVTLIISALIAAAVFIALLKYVKILTIPSKIRFTLILIAVAAGAGGWFCLYNGAALYDALPSFANEFSNVSASDHKGFLFTFLSHISSYEYAEPQGYDIHAVPQTDENAPDAVTVPENKINVIAVMSESFFDMEACENAKFYDGLSPTPNLDRLRADGMYGSILVPGYAGSTASTEFEFLTGINISNLDSAMPVVYKTHVTRDAYSLAQMFDDMGYTTEAFHAGHAWFYNRAAVYPRLGFQNSYFDDAFEYTADDLVNYYVSDKITADKIIAEYDEYLKSGKKNGYFSFTVTIQNHGPYGSSEPDIKRLIRTSDMSDDEYSRLCNYANGLYDADALLGRVCDFAETAPEPTVVVFFGDHLPYFDAQGAALTHLGLDVNSDTPAARENRYLTPFIIHGNKAFRDMKGAYVHADAGHISSSFLAPRMLDYAGINIPPYFDAVGAIGGVIPEISGSFFITGKGYTASLTEDETKLLTYYDYLSYWALREYKRDKKRP